MPVAALSSPMVRPPGPAARRVWTRTATARSLSPAGPRPSPAGGGTVRVAPVWWVDQAGGPWLTREHAYAR